MASKFVSTMGDKPVINLDNVVGLDKADGIESQIIFHMTGNTCLLWDFKTEEVRNAFYEEVLTHVEAEVIEPPKVCDVCGENLAAVDGECVDCIH